MAKKPPSDRLNRFIFTASMGDGLNMLLVVLLCVAAAVFYKFVWQNLLACFLLALLMRQPAGAFDARVDSTGKRLGSYAHDGQFLRTRGAFCRLETEARHTCYCHGINEPVLARDGRYECRAETPRRFPGKGIVRAHGKLLPGKQVGRDHGSREGEGSPEVMAPIQTFSMFHIGFHYTIFVMFMQ